MKHTIIAVALAVLGSPAFAADLPQPGPDCGVVGLSGEAQKCPAGATITLPITPSLVAQYCDLRYSVAVIERYVVCVKR